MEKNKQAHQEIRRVFQNAERILISSHIRPDGDAVGSLLGLGLALEAVGKDVQMVLADGIPASFKHLVGSDRIVKKASGEFDCVVIVDSSDLERIGAVLDAYPSADINIDHHITNLNFARLNLVDLQAVATAQILAENLPAWGLPLDVHIASALLTGIITDSLGFRTSNMTPQALRTAASLMEMGANLPELYRQAMVKRSYMAARFWGYGLTQLERDDKLVWATLTMKARREIGYPGRDDADLINVLSAIDDAAIAMVFVEQPNGSVKVSWRAQPGWDVSGLALSFGGGGHPAASGAQIKGTLDEVRTKVLQETRKLFLKEEATI